MNPWTYDLEIPQNVWLSAIDTWVFVCLFGFLIVFIIWKNIWKSSLEKLKELSLFNLEN